MDFTKLLAELKSERERVEQAIIVLERLGGRTGKRRGRPPKWLARVHVDAVTNQAPTPTVAGKKRTLSAEARQRIAAAQKKRWAAAKGKK